MLGNASIISIEYIVKVTKRFMQDLVREWYNHAKEKYQLYLSKVHVNLKLDQDIEK